MVWCLVLVCVRLTVTRTQSSVNQFRQRVCPGLLGHALHRARPIKLCFESVRLKNWKKYIYPFILIHAGVKNWLIHPGKRTSRGPPCPNSITFASGCVRLSAGETGERNRNRLGTIRRCPKNLLGWVDEPFVAHVFRMKFFF